MKTVTLISDTMKFQKTGVSKPDSETNKKQQQRKPPPPPHTHTHKKNRRVQDQNDIGPLESKTGSLEANGAILSKP